MHKQNIEQKNFFDGNRLSHAYIVVGAQSELIAMAAVCSARSGNKPCRNCIHCDKASRDIHPDITVITKLPDKREILVNQIRELKKDAFIVPNEAQKKAYIIAESDLMNSAAQNAFLQLLEDPPSHAVFILNTENPAALLQTVRSRCVEIRAESQMKAADEPAEDMTEELFTALENGNASIISFMFKLEKLDKSAFDKFLSTARDKAVSKLRSSRNGNYAIKPETLSHLEKVLVNSGDMLELNVSTGHLSAMICANLLEVE